MKTRVFLTSVAIIATLFIVPNIAIADPAKQKTTDTGEQQQSPAKTVASQKYVDDTKQTKIPATSDGTNNTPNYVYDSTNNTTADGSVVTTGATDGTISQRGIANDATRDNNDILTNGHWIANINAVESMVSHATSDVITNNINERIINGMPFSDKHAHQFAGPEDTTGVYAYSYVRTAAIPALPTVKDLTDWTVIVVQPGVTATTDNKTAGTFDTNGLRLAINDPEFSRPILYRDAAVDDATAPIVWNARYPSIFVFYSKAGKDGAWLFAGSGDDLPTHKVNGAPLSNASSYYYGTSTVSTAGISVTIPSIASTANTLPETGQIIVVQPPNNGGLEELTCTTTIWKLALNKFDAANILYEDTRLSCNPSVHIKQKQIVWKPYRPSMFVFNGTNWVFLGHGSDQDTTYTELNDTASGSWSGPAGTGTTAGVISPSVLKSSIHRVDLVDTVTPFSATNSAITENDTVIGAFGKAQGQINNRQTLIPATSDGTNNTPNYVYDATNNSTADGSVVTTGATDGTISQRGIATAAVSDGNGGYTNGDWIPTVNAMMNEINTVAAGLKWSALFWSDVHPTAINNYSTTFDNNSNNWIDGTQSYLVRTDTFANALARKQTILPGMDTGNAAPAGKQTITIFDTLGRPGQVNPSPTYITAAGSQPLTQKSGADNVILYVNGTKTLAEFEISNFGGSTEQTILANQHRIQDALVSLELLKDVYSALHTEITSHVPSGTPNTVANYGANGALGSGIATANAATYNATTGALENGTNIATIAAVDTRQKKKVCAGYEPAEAGQPAHDGTHPGDEDYCWLWIFPD